MQEILVRIEGLCLELPPTTLLIVGIITILVGLFLWLGGNYYSGFIVGFLGAALGSLGGLMVSRLIGVAYAWGALIGAAAMGLLAMHLKNIVIIILAVFIFAVSSGTGYLSYAWNRATVIGEDAQDRLKVITSPYELSITPDKSRVATKPGISDDFRGSDATKKAGSFLGRLKVIISDAWAATSSNRWPLVFWALAGGIAGLLLVWFIKKIVMALCCSIVGSTVTIAGVQTLLMVKGIAMMQALQGRPKVLPAIFIGMILLGWMTQVFLVTHKAKRKIIVVKK
ncbi:MAG: hypothetical protein KAJ52_05705 [Sedimentisphaerales bacterium]|nr:hypothetical protein [Sedimentisphaerales bacterium]